MSSQVLGVVACISSLLYMAFGLPIQIRKIYKEKTTAGLSLFMILTLFGTTTSWIVYSLTIRDKFILIANVPGAICALIILVQFWLYRPASKS
mgnify:FL=1